MTGTVLYTPCGDWAARGILEKALLRLLGNSKLSETVWWSHPAHLDSYNSSKDLEMVALTGPAGVPV